MVTPPAAAAALALAMVSRCSAPGSPTNARMSMRPGETTSPAQSTTRASARQLVARDRGADAGDDAVDRDQPAARLGLLHGIDEAGVDEGDRRRWTA